MKMTSRYRQLEERPDQHAAKVSWWLNADSREAFAVMAAGEQTRLKATKSYSRSSERVIGTINGRIPR